jgi:hypothetical protein
MRILPVRALSDDFLPEPYLPENGDAYYLRHQQSPRAPDSWRHLHSTEIEALIQNGSTSDDWDTVYVSDPFAPHLIRNSRFSGLVRLGRLDEVVLEYHDLRTPVGITNSLLIDCDIGDNTAIHNVRYLSHFIIGDYVILLNVDEMNTTNYAKFGNGIIKDGEAESTRIWMSLINEAGGRSVVPFDGMLPADAYLWARYRDDTDLQRRLLEITQQQFDSRRGFYGQVGTMSVVKNSRILKDVKIGCKCYIKGANKLKNLTINSSDDEPTQIGEGVELVNGIIGCGCRVFYGCKAVRFVMGNNATLKYGARLIHSYLGDNSTVSCCEILNNLIFPAHEQHHNNSFLTASLLLGQSNIAAGATIGSNHNSRANDGEILAGRGFWPGLCTTLKHSSRFASFTLLAKADYPCELDIPLPFSLVSHDVARDRLQVMPAYWWQHNMYALARNAWKFVARDQRKSASQHIEFDYLAPDTAEEMLQAIQLLEIWSGREQLRQDGQREASASQDELLRLGRRWLQDPSHELASLEIAGRVVENSNRPVLLLKVPSGYRAYREMLLYYAVKNLLAYLQQHPGATRATMLDDLAGPRERHWVNLGGQLVAQRDLDRLRADIGAGRCRTWSEIHAVYDRLWQAYPRDKQRHALAVLMEVLEDDVLSADRWDQALDEAVRIQQTIQDQVYHSRLKDYQNPFRRLTFRNEEELTATLGSPENDAFVVQTRAATEEFGQRVQSVKRRG